MSSPSSPVTLLKEARSLIRLPKHWNQGHWSHLGTHCAVGAVEAVAGQQSCPDGSIEAREASWPEPAIGALRALEDALPREDWSIIGFNDEHSHADVLKLFDKAICEAEQAEKKQDAARKGDS